MAAERDGASCCFLDDARCRCRCWSCSRGWRRHSTASGRRKQRRSGSGVCVCVGIHGTGAAPYKATALFVEPSTACPACSTTHPPTCLTAGQQRASATPTPASWPGRWGSSRSRRRRCATRRRPPAACCRTAAPCSAATASSATASASSAASCKASACMGRCLLPTHCTALGTTHAGPLL